MTFLEAHEFKAYLEGIMSSIEKDIERQLPDRILGRGFNEGSRFATQMIYKTFVERYLPKPEEPTEDNA